jgi:hypothetical protein
MDAQSNQFEKASPWMDRVLFAVVVATMLLSLLGYMHA